MVLGVLLLSRMEYTKILNGYWSIWMTLVAIDAKTILTSAGPGR